MQSIEERNSLVLQHLRLAQHLAIKRHKTVPPTVQYDDLLSAAYGGLIRAAELFSWDKVNPKAKKPFECYARRRIAGQMNDYLRACNWGTRSYPQDVLSAEYVVGYDHITDNSTTIGDSFKSKDRPVDDKLNGLELFEKVIRSLPPREKRIFRLRFMYNLTMRQIADCTNLSESRVSQILSNSVIYLRHIWGNRSSELWEEINESKLN